MPRSDTYFTTASSDNPGSFANRPREEVQALGRKGGKARQEQRKQAETFKQALEWALSMPAIRGQKDVEKVRRHYPDITNREAMAIAMVAETIRKGDVKAFMAVRDTTGELPAQTVNVTHNEPFSISIETVGSPIFLSSPEAPALDAPTIPALTPTLDLDPAPLMSVLPAPSEEEEEP